MAPNAKEPIVPMKDLELIPQFVKTYFFKFARAKEWLRNLLVFQLFSNTLPLRYSVSQCQGTNRSYESSKISSTKCNNLLFYHVKQGWD